MVARGSLLRTCKPIRMDSVLSVKTTHKTIRRAWNKSRTCDVTITVTVGGKGSRVDKTCLRDHPIPILQFTPRCHPLGVAARHRSGRAHVPKSASVCGESTDRLPNARGRRNAREIDQRARLLRIGELEGYPISRPDLWTGLRARRADRENHGRSALQTSESLSSPWLLTDLSRDSQKTGSQPV